MNLVNFGWTLQLLLLISEGNSLTTTYPTKLFHGTSCNRMKHLQSAVSSDPASLDIDDEDFDFEELVDAIMEDSPDLLLDDMDEDMDNEDSEDEETAFKYESSHDEVDELAETVEEDVPMASARKKNDNTPMTEEEELLDFLEMLDETPIGTLEEVDDLVMLRDSIVAIMDSLSSEQPMQMDTAETLEHLLQRMVGEWQAAAAEKMSADQLQLLEPTKDDFLRVIKAWEAVAGESSERVNTNLLPEVVSHVFQTFCLQMNLFHDGLTSVEPDVEAYEAVLRVLSNSRERGMDRKLFHIFEQAPFKTTAMYQLVIASLAKSRDRGAADRAEKILREAVEQHPPTKLNGKRSGMTIDSFNVVLTAWAKSGLPYGPERAEKLIMFMDQVDNENGGHGMVKPNIFSFTSLIDAYAQKSDWDSAAQSERILRRLLEQYLSGEEGIPEPSVASWTIAISAWARLSKKGFKGAALRAGKLLNYMEDLNDDGKIGFGPDAIVYVTCMNAFAFSKIVEGPSKAEEILDLTHELYLEGDETMKPSAKSIRIVLDSWIRSNTTDAMDEAELLLERYEDLLDSLGPPTEPVEVLDDTRDIYRTMLFGFAKKGFPVQAKHYLDLMIQKGMKPDCFCYDKVIEANTFLNDEGSYQRSYEVFQMMEERRQLGEVSPNERVYTSFIRGTSSML